MPQVYNRHHNNVPTSAIFIGRPSRFGNPFPITERRDRDTAIKMFENYILSNPRLLEKVKRELRDKDLVCYCAPLPCHGDVLLRIANEEENNV